MDNLFSYDNKFFEVLGKIADVIILNILFIVGCLPIITIGASVSSAYLVGMKVVRDEDTYITKEFIKGFKENLKISTVIWLIMLVIGGVLVFDVYISTLILNVTMSKILQVIFTMAIIVFIFAITYIFPIISKFENTIKNTMINSILISIQNLPYTMIMILLNLSPLLLIYFMSNYWEQILFFYTVIGFGLAIYVNSMLFNKIFNKYIN